ncbi:class II aldolase/adducin family protein [uncultured Roseibium sp.]|uniref:class II aldolase/adducin family protein n=1 Tax=uncultured Roseibium sp. TaxID=1936171 RepID=UPI00262FFB43|nr:class II aldolase/adducin family protein [uncultured Roseibium sp.]
MNVVTDVDFGCEARQSELELREDLAAAFRMAVRFGWHESVGNHFSAAVSEDGSKFLMNPKWRHFSEVKASDLLLLDVNDDTVMEGPYAPDPSAWCIHGTVHRMNPKARVLFHCHSPNATALATLQDPGMKPIDLNTARFFGKVAIDLGFGGMADEAEEGRRIAQTLSDKPVLIMGNHGISISATTVPEAFESLYFFERAAETLLKAYATGQPLAVMSDNLAAKTAAEWEPYVGMGYAHFDYWKRELDRTEPDYRD